MAMIENQKNMEQIKVLDEKGNPVILRPIKIKGQHMIDAYLLNNSSINFKEVAKDMVIKKMTEEMAKHLLFTEKELSDGGLIIESSTYFYGL